MPERVTARITQDETGAYLANMDAAALDRLGLAGSLMADDLQSLWETLMHYAMRAGPGEVQMLIEATILPAPLPVERLYGEIGGIVDGHQ